MELLLEVFRNVLSNEVTNQEEEKKKDQDAV